MTNDTIADMLTRIRNANLAKHQIVQIPSTKVTKAIAKVLLDEGLIESFEELDNGLRGSLLISRSLTAVIPFIKKNNFNYMIQKLTEIGVNKFMIYKPDLSDQSIAKKDFEKIISKSKEIIINVCKQCGNNFLPNIEYYSNLENAIKQIQENHDKYIFDTDATEYFLQDELDNDSSVTIITGPESGFSNKEIKIIANGELKIRYLGRNILRSETAPIVVSSIIKNHFGRI